MSISLSVIIVAWRSRDEILPCVRSIPRSIRLAQGPEQACGGAAEGLVEIVVVDNSLNADGTADLLAREAPTVRCLVPAENLGFGRGQQPRLPRDDRRVRPLPQSRHGLQRGGVGALPRAGAE
jgi:GT2 family glycosyltransferase